MYNIGNVLNATEFFNLKWLILCYVDLTLILKKNYHSNMHIKIFTEEMIYCYMELDFKKLRREATDVE